MISPVEFLVGIVMLEAVGVESAEDLIGLKTVGTVATGVAGILIGVMAIGVIVIDWKAGDGLTWI